MQLHLAGTEAESTFERGDGRPILRLVVRCAAQGLGGAVQLAACLVIENGAERCWAGVAARRTVSVRDDDSTEFTALDSIRSRARVAQWCSSFRAARPLRTEPHLDLLVQHHDSIDELS